MEFATQILVVLSRLLDTLEWLIASLVNFASSSTLNLAMVLAVAAGTSAVVTMLIVRRRGVTVEAESVEVVEKVETV
ncbi:MAG: hypothetical protein QXI97_03670, partial [Nitrososphaerota archaeon]